MMRPWTTRHILSATILAGALLFAGFLLGRPPVSDGPANLYPVPYSDIAGWRADDHAAAFATFRRSCEKIAAVYAARRNNSKKDEKPHPLSRICRAALEMKSTTDNDSARAFFETHFLPHRYAGDAVQGFVTGYYEPELKGSRMRSEDYSVPVYSVPDDLEQLFPDEERAQRNNEMTAGRRVDGKLVPYYDRKDIEQGALEGRRLEILWLADPVDTFYMHIQGSGRVALAEGGHVRLSYAAKNGHAYTAIGSILIRDGEIAREDMSMAAVRGWLADHPDKARALMWQNRSYIFFKERPDDPEAPGPQGAQGVALTPLRSLAVDTSIHPAGTPVWVDAPDLDLHGKPGFHALMIAQDTGSAIRGPERGDIFWGSGEKAGALAGSTKHAARFTIFLPKGDNPER